MKNNCILFFTFLTLSLLISCKDQNPAQPKQTPIVTVKTVTIKLGDIENYIILNGKTVYLKKNSIVSPISGYIVKINVKFGDKVQKNEVLFEIQTKENKALINTGSIPRNIGIIKVLASSDGYINELNITETGGYLTEGGMLCSIVDNKNLMLQVNVPFQYNELIKKATKCKIFLADNTQFEGIVSQILPVIKEAEQTQTVLIKPITNKKIPENLNIKVEFINSKHQSSFLVPKAAVMCNETQTEFWIMKIANKNLAIKIPVLKGIENDSIVEIISSVINKNDIVISEGAYSLSDSTIVKIVK